MTEQTPTKPTMTVVRRTGEPPVSVSWVSSTPALLPWWRRVWARLTGRGVA